MLAAGRSETVESKRALDHLARCYWYPLYAYARRRGVPDQEARDLTQGFFARLIERRDLENLEPGKGRFRSYLLTSLKNFLINEDERSRALKRGGGAQPISLDVPISLDAEDGPSRYALEPAHEMTPEKLFERSWARTVLENAVQGLQEDYAAQGKTDLFRVLKPQLVADDDSAPQAELAQELGMSPGALKVAVHRLRKRYAERLRSEIADTLSDPGQTEDEIRHLFEALGP